MTDSGARAQDGARSYCRIVPQQGRYPSAVLGLDLALDGERPDLLGQRYLEDVDERTARLGMMVDDVLAREKPLEAARAEIARTSGHRFCAVVSNVGDSPQLDSTAILTDEGLFSSGSHSAVQSMLEANDLHDVLPFAAWQRRSEHRMSKGWRVFEAAKSFAGVRPIGQPLETGRPDQGEPNLLVAIMLGIARIGVASFVKHADVAGR
jgi:hypothetical protein